MKIYKTNKFLKYKMMHRKHKINFRFIKLNYKSISKPPQFIISLPNYKMSNFVYIPIQFNNINNNKLMNTPNLNLE
jgi:hypothetical protein